MALSCTTVVWRGLTLASDASSPFGVRNVAGWDEMPDTRLDSEVRPQQHGRFDSAVWADERIVTLSGQIVSPSRDALLAELAQVMTLTAFAGEPEELVITRAGVTRTAWARLTAFKTPTDLDWSVGKVPFAVEWRCRDPYRYGAAVTDSTQFAQDTGGLEFDLFTDGTLTDVGFLDFGDPGSVDGLVTVTNTGGVAAWPTYSVTGPTPDGGFAIVADGRTIQFERPVAAGSTLVIDTASGTALLDGADYSRYLTRREWTSVAPGESLTAFFSPLGGATSAVLTASIRPPFL